MPCTCQKSGSQPAQAQASTLNSKPAFVSMRYTGPTSTTASGPASGRQYTFSRTGMTLRVDARDKAALAKVPHLRQI